MANASSLAACIISIIKGTTTRMAGQSWGHRLSRPEVPANFVIDLGARRGKPARGTSVSVDHRRPPDLTLELLSAVVVAQAEGGGPRKGRVWVYLNRDGRPDIHLSIIEAYRSAGVYEGTWWPPDEVKDRVIGEPRWNEDTFTAHLVRSAFPGAVRLAALRELRGLRPR